MNPDTPSGNGNMLVVYFSAEGHTGAVAERIVELTGADIHRIEAVEPYAANPYDDSDRIQREAYNDLRPGVANLLDEETIAQIRYDFRRFALLVASTRDGGLYVPRSIFPKHFPKTSMRMTLRRRDVPTMRVSICRAVQTVRKAGCVELELLNRHIKQVKAEKNRNGRISDNGSNLFNALGCVFYVFYASKTQIHHPNHLLM